MEERPEALESSFDAFYEEHARLLRESGEKDGAVALEALKDLHAAEPQYVSEAWFITGVLVQAARIARGDPPMNVYPNISKQLLWEAE